MSFPIGLFIKKNVLLLNWNWFKVFISWICFDHLTNAAAFFAASPKLSAIVILKLELVLA